ncbi:MAG: leucine-rich repeat protein [Clostridiales bacterium]|nr:leucine-rich repeat protein [Clostridiales bacterium]
MKKTLSIILALALFVSTFSALSIISYAENTSGYYKYIINSSTNEATITGYTGNEENIVIPETLGGYRVTAIDVYAFGYYATNGYEYNLKSITISRYVKEIGAVNFSHGPGDYLGDTIPYAPFYVDSNNRYFSAVDGVLFNYNKTELVRCPMGKKDNYTIPTTVISIRADAFSDCIYITGITIPNGVTEIKERTFLGCTSLATVIIPDGVTEIKYAAFSCVNYDCTIQTPCSSYAYNYAIENGINVKATHTFDENNTCTVCGLWNGESRTLKLAGISNTAKGVQIKWNKIAGADGYLIYRKSASNESWSKIATVDSQTTVSYTDSSAKSGNSYIYTVKAYKGNKYSKYDSNGLTIKYLSVPDIKGLYRSVSGTEIRWNKTAGASGYYVYRKTESESYKKIATVKGESNCSYTDKNTETGIKYTYYIKAYNGDYNSVYQEKSIRARRFSVKLSATSYVYDGKVKTPKVIVVDTDGKNVSSSFYTVKYPSGRKNIGKYTVQVEFNGDGDFLKKTEKLSFTIKPKAPSLTVSSPKKKSLSAKWGTSSGATYYQLQVSKKSDFSSLILNKSNLKGGKNAIISSNISSGTKYYIRIRAVKKTDNGNICSSWTTKSIKAK